MLITTYALPDGRMLQAGQAFTLRFQATPEFDDHLSFPANWLELQSEEQLAEFGITRVVEESAPPPPPTIANLMDFAADRRRMIANGSTVINVGTREISVWVDAESRTAILGLLPIAQVDPDFILPGWKGSDGEFYDLTASEIVAIWQGGLTFISRCFSAERAAQDQITSGALMTFEQVENFSEWPNPAVAAA